MRWWIGILALLVPALAQSFEVVSGEARYRVREQLVQIGIADAVGTTKAVKGEVRLQGSQATGSFTVDLRELKSDQAGGTTTCARTPWRPTASPRPASAPSGWRGFPTRCPKAASSR
jgi:hypothetical protein